VDEQAAALKSRITGDTHAIQRAGRIDQIDAAAEIVLAAPIAADQAVDERQLRAIGHQSAADQGLIASNKGVVDGDRGADHIDPAPFPVRRLVAAQRAVDDRHRVIADIDAGAAAIRLVVVDIRFGNRHVGVGGEDAAAGQPAFIAGQSAVVDRQRRIGSIDRAAIVIGVLAVRQRQLVERQIGDLPLIGHGREEPHLLAARADEGRAVALHGDRRGDERQRRITVGIVHALVHAERAAHRQPDHVRPGRVARRAIAVARRVADAVGGVVGVIDRLDERALAVGRHRHLAVDHGDDIIRRRPRRKLRAHAGQRQQQRRPGHRHGQPPPQLPPPAARPPRQPRIEPREARHHPVAPPQQDTRQPAARLLPVCRHGSLLIHIRTSHME